MSEQDSEQAPADATAAGTGTMVAEGGEEPAFKMSLVVDIQNAGPCKKHVRVQVPRSDLEHFYEDSVKELVTSAAVPGFPPTSPSTTTK